MSSDSKSSFNHQFKDVSSSLPDVRGSTIEATKQGLSAMGTTSGPRQKKIAHGASAFFGSLSMSAMGYMSSGKPQQVWQGVQQNNAAFAERNTKK